MKKRGIILLIAVPLLMAALTAVWVYLWQGAYDAAQARNRLIGTALSDCLTDYTSGTDDDVLQKLTARSAYSIRKIKKRGNVCRIDLSLRSRDYGSEIRRFNAADHPYLNDEKRHLDRLVLLSEAATVEKDFTLTAIPQDAAATAWEIQLTPAFVNAYLGYVYSEEACEAPDFLATAVDDFGAATDIYVDLRYHYEDIDSIIKTATTVGCCDQYIYYSTYHDEGTKGGTERFAKTLKRYNIETRETKVIFTFDDFLDGVAYGLHYINCLNNGALVAEENSNSSGVFDSKSYLFDYRNETLQEIRCAPDLSAFASAVYADYEDGTVYYAEGQDGAGDVLRFTAEDEEAAVAVSAGGDYLYLNSLSVKDGVLRLCLLNEDAYERSGYQEKTYGVYLNEGTAVGKALVENVDGKIAADKDGALCYFRDGALLRRDGDTETALTEKNNRFRNAEVRLTAGDCVYVLYRDANNGLTPSLCRINTKTGKIKHLGAAAPSIVKGY